MANRKATFAKRQRETELKDRAKQKEDRRSQKRGEVRDTKGPQIAWDEAVYAVTTDEPPLSSGGDGSDAAEGDTADPDGEPGPSAAPRSDSPSAPASAQAPASPRRAG